MKVKSDHRSEFSNLSNWKEEAWKNQGFNNFTIYYIIVLDRQSFEEDDDKNYNSVYLVSAHMDTPAISVQWLELVYEMVTFFRFAKDLEETFDEKR